MERLQQEVLTSELKQLWSIHAMGSELSIEASVPTGWHRSGSHNSRRNTQLQLGMREKDVGELPSLRNKDTRQAAMNTDVDSGQVDRDDKFVFISHTGRDRVKDLIAGPTFWFLTNVLKVSAFVDNRSIAAGKVVIEELAEAAQKCTHALIILSPNFRKRKYCVMELNTFMRRHQDEDGICVVPALWKRFDLDDFPDDVRGLAWIQHDPLDEADYITQTLWPNLARRLGCNQKIGQDPYLNEEYLLSYIDCHRSVPAPLVAFAKRHYRFRLPVVQRLLIPIIPLLKRRPLSSVGGGQDIPPQEPLIVGVMFSRCYMDDNEEWNDRIRRRRNHITSNLGYLVKHGRIVHGDIALTEQRVGFLGLGKAVVRLECEIELEDMNDGVKSALRSIRQLLVEAGTGENEMKDLLYGTAWKGSIEILLTARNAVFEKLWEATKIVGSKLRVCGRLVPFDLIPAFVVQGLPVDQCGTEHSDGHLLLSSIHDMCLLLPTSPTARGKLVAGGVPSMMWDTVEPKSLSRFLKVAKRISVGESLPSFEPSADSVLVENLVRGAVPTLTCLDDDESSCCTEARSSTRRSHR